QLAEDAGLGADLLAQVEDLAVGNPRREHGVLLSDVLGANHSGDPEFLSATVDVDQLGSLDGGDAGIVDAHHSHAHYCDERAGAFAPTSLIRRGRVADA